MASAGSTPAGGRARTRPGSASRSRSRPGPGAVAAPPAAAAPRARRSSSSAPPAPAARIRWDRLGRVAMLFVLCCLLYLYISPARSLWRAIGESRSRQAAVATLSAANARLRAEQASLGTAAAVEQQARSLGLVRPGEKEYVISGLPAN